jgi:hypothetical protein
VGKKRARRKPSKRAQNPERLKARAVELLSHRKYGLTATQQKRIDAIPLTMAGPPERLERSRVPFARTGARVPSVQHLTSPPLGSLRAHDCLRLCRGLLQYLLQDELPGPELRVVTRLLNLIRDMATTVEVTPTFIHSVVHNARSVCDNLETTFPRTEQSLMLHLLRHLPEQMVNWGSPAGYWMFFVDRYVAVSANQRRAHRRREGGSAPPSESSTRRSDLTSASSTT